MFHVEHRTTVHAGPRGSGFRPSAVPHKGASRKSKYHSGAEPSPGATRQDVSRGTYPKICGQATVEGFGVSAQVNPILSLSPPLLDCLERDSRFQGSTWNINQAGHSVHNFFHN